MYCRNCGKELKEGARFCSNCRYEIKSKIALNYNQESKSIYNPTIDYVENQPLQKKPINGNEKRTYIVIIGAIMVVTVIIVAILLAVIIGFKMKKIPRNISNISEIIVDDFDNKNDIADGENDSINERGFEVDDDIELNRYDDNEIIYNDNLKALSYNSIIGIHATSELSEYGKTHYAEYLVDGTLNNAWVEGASGQGIGEEITIDFDDEYLISGVIINSGYQKNESLYYKNSRPKDIEIIFSDGNVISYTLEDLYSAQRIDCDCYSSYLTIRINSVYAGTVYEDTVISEVELY